MYKDFDKWNEQKKLLENRNTNFLFKEREIWWCSVGINISFESCGKGKTFRRPILVLKKLSKNAFIGIPLSTQQRQGSWFVMLIVEGKKANALLNQIRMFSVNRFQRRISVLDENEFFRIKQKLEEFLEF